MTTAEFHAWAEYAGDGRQRFDRVGRSWGVFVLNANDLIRVVAHAELDPVAWLTLTDPGGSPEDQQFWLEIDRWLHNVVAAAGAIIDHTRQLIRFYPHEPEFVDEWTRRNGVLAASDRAKFLRRFRNYLLHIGVAPVAQRIELGPNAGPEQFTIHLSADQLLKWDDWGSSSRKYIASFDPGPPLRRTIEEYAKEMQDLYRWLLAQHAVLHVPGVRPRHLRK